MLTQLITILAWLALPALFIAIIDDWFYRPRRRMGAQVAQVAQVAQGAQGVQGAQGPRPDPPFVAVIYYLLPVLLVAGVLRLLLSERLDFSLVLLIVVLLAG